MSDKQQGRVPQAPVDPFDASLDVAPVDDTPAPAPGGTSDPFDASLGASGPAGASGASEVPPLPSGRTKPWTDLELQVLGVKRPVPAGQDLGAGNQFAGSLIEGLPIVGPWAKRNLDEGVAHLRSWSSGKPVEEERQNMEAMKASTLKAHPTAATAGEISGQIIGYTGAAAAAPAAFGMTAATLPGAAATSAATNALVAGADAYARGQDPVKAAAAGGALGAAAPLVGAAASRLFTNYVQPEVLRLADLAVNRFGIPLGADLVSTNPMIRFASSVLDRMPMTGGGAAREARQLAYNRAWAQSIGEDADHLTPAVMARARTRIGHDFEYAANNTPQIGADAQFGNDLTRIWNDVSNPVDRALTMDERGVVEAHMRRVIDMFGRGNGSITGRQFQQMTRTGTALDKATKSSNPNIRHYALEIEGAMRDALMRFAPQDAAETLAQARRQWWALKTLEDAAERDPIGNVSFARAIGDMRRGTNDFAYIDSDRGGPAGEMADLARIGSLFLKEPPSSGTAERMWIMSLVEGMSTASLWALLHHPIAGAVGAAVPLVGAQAARVARSPRLGNALINSALGAPGPITRGAAAAGRYGGPALIQSARPYIEDRLPSNEPGGNAQ